MAASSCQLSVVRVQRSGNPTTTLFWPDDLSAVARRAKVEALAGSGG
jgi:hypothetical protein